MTPGRFTYFAAVILAAVTGVVGISEPATAAPAPPVTSAPVPAGGGTTIPPASTGPGAPPTTPPPPGSPSSTLPPASAGGPAPPQTVPVAPTTSTTSISGVIPGREGGPAAPSPSTTLPDIRGIQLDTANPAQFDNLNGELKRAQRELSAAQAAQQRDVVETTAATAKVSAGQARLVLLGRQERAAIEGLRITRERLRDLAVSSYLSGGPLRSINSLLNSSSVTDFFRRKSFIAVVSRNRGEALKNYGDARGRASKDAVATSDALRRDRGAEVQAAQALAEANAVVIQRTLFAFDRAQAVQLVSSALGFPGTDIPRLVLDAYRRAATTVQTEGCRLPWWGLAGIGRVESDHGRAQHAVLTAKGELAPPILGLPLNGQNGTALIAASDKGVYTGDPVFEHAVGPMQFLPSTWAVVGRDGNGDGKADPNNIFDAALGAASYLCRAGAGAVMDTDAGLRQAYFSYNHSDGYVEEVLALAHAYATIDVLAAP